MKIIDWNTITAEQKQASLQRATRSNSTVIRHKTDRIIAKVKACGDDALFKMADEYDGVQLQTLAVSHREIEDASQKISQKIRNAIEFAAERIEHYHRSHVPKDVTVDTQDGVICQRVARPIQGVGLYVPGGSAPLVSTLLMLAIPAQLAGCPQMFVCTPPNTTGHIDPALLYAAKLCGITRIFTVGGAQAIAAMAYGTETIPKVDKIFGPGNAWVTEAKQQVSQDPNGASIDLPAGPSELMVIADQSANPSFVAADLLSQAEHGPDSQVMLITDSADFANNVLESLQAHLSTLPRKEIAQQSLQHSRIILVDSLQTAIAISNQYAPEHLSLQIKDPMSMAENIQCAGAVFLGTWACESLGDYVTGSNHVLPTDGYAKSMSGLCLADFLNFINFQSVDKPGLRMLGPHASILAELEGLSAHKLAVDIRLNTLEK